MDRKEIVKTLEAYAGVKAKYMRAPSFAYQIIIAQETLTIDRIGKITTAAGEEVTLERLIGGVLEEVVDEDEPTEFEVGIPMEGHTGVTLKNLLNMIYSKQALIKKVFELKEDIINTDFIERINRTEIPTLDDFKTVLEEHERGSCPGIKFNFLDHSITFKFCRNLPEPEKLKAYTDFICHLNKSAKAQKYASPKVTMTDNEKFTMRTWLIRLGFVGAEYKKVREILLKNLEGNGAFRHVTTTENNSK